VDTSVSNEHAASIFRVEVIWEQMELGYVGRLTRMMTDKDSGRERGDRSLFRPMGTLICSC
jgi:hypothetical protein